MTDITIRLGGVPEHFNIPIHQAKDKGYFKAKGIEAEWKTYKGGTGQMTKALRNDDVDICILLTEGIILDIINGNSSKIISGYVKSPLIWGIHTGAKNRLKYLNNIYNKTYAISRFGSGSHLMPIVQATLNNRSINREQFVIIRNLEGALTSLTKLESDIFYWEKFTTKPFVDNGQLRRLGEFVTPWPCFVIAASDKILHRQPRAVADLLRIIHLSCAEFMEGGDYIQQVQTRFDYKEEDIERWYHATEWFTDGWVSDKMLRNVVHNLKLAELIPEGNEFPELVWKR